VKRAGPGGTGSGSPPCTEEVGGGPEQVLVDPMAIDPSGLTTLDAWQPDKEGRLLAYQLSEGGDEESLLRVIDLAVLEGDTRFRDTRVRMLNSVTVALADVISSVRKNGSGPDPNAMSGALVAMLAHTAAHQTGFESWEIHVRDLRRALADLVYWGATGRMPPR